MIKTAARKAGIGRWKDVFPHCLRKAFESAVRNAGLDPKDQEFLMGHILPGTQDVYYDKTKVEDLRKKYTRVNFFPEKTGLTEDSRKRQIIDMAKVFGYSEDRIKKIEETLARHRTVDDAMPEIRRLKEDSDEGEGERTTISHNGNGKYFVVRGEDELVNRLNDGWKLVQPLNEEKYLLQFT
jgi:hypothetical protein